MQGYCFPLCSQYPLIPVLLFPGALFPQGSELPSGAPILTLRFSYICPDRHLRRYLVLEPDAQAAVQVRGPGGWWVIGRLGAGVHLLTAVSGAPCLRSCLLC